MKMLKFLNIFNTFRFEITRTRGSMVKLLFLLLFLLLLLLLLLDRLLRLKNMTTNFYCSEKHDKTSRFDSGWGTRQNSKHGEGHADHEKC